MSWCMWKKVGLIYSKQAPNGAAVCLNCAFGRENIWKIETMQKKNQVGNYLKLAPSRSGASPKRAWGHAGICPRLVLERARFGSTMWKLGDYFKSNCKKKERKEAICLDFPPPVHTLAHRVAATNSSLMVSCIVDISFSLFWLIHLLLWLVSLFHEYILPGHQVHYHLTENLCCHCMLV